MAAAKKSTTKSAGEGDSLSLGEPSAEGQLKVLGNPDFAPANPSDPIPDGQVTVTREAKTDEEKRKTSDGNITEGRKVSSNKTAKKKLDEIDLEDLPVAVSKGEVQLSVRAHAGRAVLSVSVVGWIGDEPVKILVSDLPDLEDAIKELRKELGA